MKGTLLPGVSGENKGHALMATFRMHYYHWLKTTLAFWLDIEPCLCRCLCLCICLCFCIRYCLCHLSSLAWSTLTVSLGRQEL